MAMSFAAHIVQNVTHTALFSLLLFLIAETIEKYSTRLTTRKVFQGTLHVVAIQLVVGHVSDP